ncbi:MAG: glycosyltransferase [Solirubrobacteraceae bacterium]|nr:glycosyltransferase [Solirubrobacteraceae bacterium]
MTAHRDIVCVGFNDWETELWTNQHHLMARLAAGGDQVLFIESLGLRKPTVAARDVSRMARRLVRGLKPPRERDGVHVLSPLVIPLHGNAAVRKVNARVLPALVGRAARKRGMQRPILWGYVPQAEVLLDTLDPAIVVYHCVDDIVAQKGIDTASFQAAEQRFARRADLVLASAPKLAERMRTLNDNVLYAPNVADTGAFATALNEDPPTPVDPALAALPGPRIVFTGAIVEKKLDFPLLVAIARARPEWSIALVGPVGLGEPETDVSALEREPNIHLLGPRRYAELPAVLRGADATMIPYRGSELTASIFPMKVYEYLAAGRPVVATPLPAIAEVQGIAVAEGADAFVAALDRALAEDTPEQRVARSAAAAANSWDARLEEIGAALERLER